MLSLFWLWAPPCRPSSAELQAYSLEAWSIPARPGEHCCSAEEAYRLWSLVPIFHCLYSKILQKSFFVMLIHYLLNRWKREKWTVLSFAKKEGKARCSILCILWGGEWGWGAEMRWLVLCLATWEMSSTHLSHVDECVMFPNIRGVFRTQDSLILIKRFTWLFYFSSNYDD